MPFGKAVKAIRKDRRQELVHTVLQAHGPVAGRIQRVALLKQETNLAPQPRGRGGGPHREDLIDTI